MTTGVRIALCSVTVPNYARERREVELETWRALPRVHVRVSCSDGETERFGLNARPFPAFLLLILKSNEISHKLFLDETDCPKKRTISTGTGKNTILYCPFQRQGNLLCGGLQKVRKPTTRTAGIYI